MVGSRCAGTFLNQFRVYVDGVFVFKKKLAYCLESGRPGLFAGIATDAMFRRIDVRELTEGVDD